MSEGLAGLLAAEVRREGFELHHWRLRPAGKRRVLQVYLHAEGGVGLDDCARVSRRLGVAIDEADAVDGSYVLEVSSPGVDRPLLARWHWQLALGERVRLLHRAEDGDRTLEGVLAGVEEDAIRLETDAGEEQLPLAQVERARVVPVLTTKRTRRDADGG